jgi:hypothetical protein
VIRANELPIPLAWVEHWPEETTEGQKTFGLVVFSRDEDMDRGAHLEDTRPC